MTKQDWTLLALAAANGKELSPVQLQKTIFLFAKQLPAADLPADFYDFVPYNYGPFCGSVYDDVATLSQAGLARVSASSGGYRQYSATSEGITRGLELARSLPVATAEYARRLVEWVQKQTFAGLVSAIYEQFPEYQVNSIFKG